MAETTSQSPARSKWEPRVARHAFPLCLIALLGRRGDVRRTDDDVRRLPAILFALEYMHGAIVAPAANHEFVRFAHGQRVAIDVDPGAETSQVAGRCHMQRLGVLPDAVVERVKMDGTDDLAMNGKRHPVFEVPRRLAKPY